MRAARVFVLLCIACFCSCSKERAEITPSFYYWKTQFELSPSEKQTMSDLGVKTLYVRLFDVDFPGSAKGPMPVGVISGLEAAPAGTALVPVVFITNRTFLNLPASGVAELAANVLYKIRTLLPHYAELQFDCDWSAATREKYFRFLQEVQKQLDSRHPERSRRVSQEKDVILSCTIRLHQVKYAAKTGVPPVQRGTLMFYNMAQLDNPENKNSIFNLPDAAKYTDHLSAYRLPLDVALPIFSWYVHYRNGGIIGLISKDRQPLITDTLYFSSLQNSSKFDVKRDHLEKGVFYRAGDSLRFETVKESELKEAAQLLNDRLSAGKRRIIFYDLDESNLKNYEKTAFTHILAGFH